MSFYNLYKNAKKYYPSLKIKYKDESLFMRMLSIILFMNRDFSKRYVTTINKTIYYPSKDYLNKNNFSASVVLLHELTHVYDAKNIFFSIAYLMPQIFALLFFPALFINIKFALLFLLFLLPLPAYYRMLYEKRAYMITLYSYYKLLKKQKAFNSTKFFALKESVIKEFTGPVYYFMWIFKNSIKEEFDECCIKIMNGEKPFKDEQLFSMIDKLINKY